MVKEAFKGLRLITKLSFFVMVVLWEIEGARVLKLLDSVTTSKVTLDIVFKSIHYDSVTVWVTVMAFVSSVVELFTYEEKVFAIISTLVSSLFIILIGVLIYWHL